MRKISLFLALMFICTPLFAWNTGNGGSSAVSSNTASSSSTLSGNDVTIGDAMQDCVTLNFNNSSVTDKPYISACRDVASFGNTQPTKSYTLLRPGAGDLIVYDDVVAYDTTPNFRWWDYSPGAEDFEAAVDDSQIVFKAVGDTSPAPHTYNTREYLSYNASADATHNDEILQLGAEAFGVSIGPTGKPDSFSQITSNDNASSAVVDIHTFNQRSLNSGTFAGFGMRIKYELEDGVGSTGEVAATDTVSWNSPTNGAETAERIFHVKRNGALAEYQRVDENLRTGLGGVTNPTSMLHVMSSESTTASGLELLNLEARSTGTVAAGFGVTARFSGTNASGTNNVSMGKIDYFYFNATANQETTEVGISQTLNGTTTEAVHFDEQGYLGMGTTNPTTKVFVVSQDSATSTVTTVPTWSHRTSGTVISGFGVGQQFALEDGSGSTDINAGGTTVSWEIPTNGSATSRLAFRTRISGSVADRYVINGQGVFSGATVVATSINATSVNSSSISASGIVAVSGAVTIAASLNTTSTQSLGWNIVSASNQACSTTCQTACVMGFAADVTGSNPVDCGNSTADSCLCGGLT